MDAVPPEAKELSATSSWGEAIPHDVQSLLLDTLARAAACAAHGAQRRRTRNWHLSFESCTARVTYATLWLCARDCAALRTLPLDACTHVTGAGMVAALHCG